MAEWVENIWALHCSNICDIIIKPFFRQHRNYTSTQYTIQTWLLTSEWTNKRTNERTKKRTNEETEERSNERTNEERMNERRTNERTNEERTNERTKYDIKIYKMHYVVNECVFSVVNGNINCLIGPTPLHIIFTPDRSQLVPPCMYHSV